MVLRNMQQDPCQGHLWAVHQLCYNKNLVVVCWHDMLTDTCQLLCRFWFDPPHQLESSLQLCIETYQALLAHIEEQGNDLALYFNLASWLMLHMVSLHAVLKSASCGAPSCSCKRAVAAGSCCFGFSL